jgi:hypothetical protein
LRINQALPFPHQLLRLGGIVPQIGRLKHGVELFQPVRCGFHIHPLPQKIERLPDRLNMVLGFGAHGGLPFRWAWIRSGDKGSPQPGEITQIGRENRFPPACFEGGI